LKGLRILSLVFVLLAATSCHRHVQSNLPSGWSDGAVIEKVQFQGNRSIAVTTIAATIQTREGGKISSELIRDDISRLRSLGFQDIKVIEQNGDAGGKILIFNVREKLPKS
jgi:outer membrane protein assembly factor BamA